MPCDLTFILGLLDRYSPAFAAAEDFDGNHGEALRLWQRMGFLAEDGEQHPCPSCPHCGEGSPYSVGGRYLCHRCYSDVDPRHLLRWRFDLERFLSWIAKGLSLAGGVRQVEERLWQLGTMKDGESRAECFFHRRGMLTERGRNRLAAYRSAMLLRALPSNERPDGFQGPSVSLLELLRQDGESLTVMGLAAMLHKGGTVRFDPASGTLWAGEEWLGDVPVGCREYHLLSLLATHLDAFVSYADLKHYVLQQTGGGDGTDEATFCQKLKRRLKAKWMPWIDRLIATSRKGDGYRLRGHVR